MRHMVRFSLLGCLAILLVSCGTKRMACFYPDDMEKKAPKWVCEETIEGTTLSAVGIGETKEAGLFVQEQQALAAARIKIAQYIRTNIDSILSTTANIASENSEIRAQSNLDLNADVITDALVSGSRLLKKTFSPNGVLYVIVGIDEAMYQAAINQVYDAQPETD